MGAGVGVVPGRRLARFATGRWRRHGDTAPGRAREAGVTLVEVMVAVAILGFAITSLVGSMTTAVTVSSVIDRRTDAQAEARRLAELVRSYDTGYLVQPSNGDPELETLYEGYLAGELGDAFASVDASVECGNGTPPVVSFSAGGCVGIPALQRVTVTVTANGDPAVRASITVVKRDADI